MLRLARFIDGVNESVGRAAAWLVIVMMAAQFAAVLLRYAFSLSFPALNEAVWYAHGLLFTLAAGYALLHDAHVRIDIFFRDASDAARAWVDLLGGLFFLLPLCAMTLWLSSSYVVNAWRWLEGSMERSGLPLVFLLKTAIWAFAILLFLQGLSQSLKALARLRGIGPAAASSNS
jgi:TRAP-type mannitol/chloroaromatic compound transport system permease small subunit